MAVLAKRRHDECSARDGRAGLCSRSTDFLQRTSQLGDLEFMWAHIDDVREAFEVQDEEAKLITPPNPGAHGPPGDRVPDPLTAAAQKGY